jgi:hypothetical protein
VVPLPNLKRVTDSVSETLFSSSLNSGRWANSRKPVTLRLSISLHSETANIRIYKTTIPDALYGCETRILPSRKTRNYPILKSKLPGRYMDLGRVKSLVFITVYSEIFLPAALGPGVQSVSNRNEYRKIKKVSG